MSRTTACRTEGVEEREVCVMLDVLGRVSGKWSLGVLSETTRGPVRFAALERALPGISRRILTLTLRDLEANGLLTRTVYPTVPPKVEYTATEQARELYAQLTGLTAWAARHPAAPARPDHARPDAGRHPA
ncbi:helix-turn-helix domain-containing protein [Streptomyces sp. DSM 44915]|uniref:Helix-turn-helix domain-containing protein n=1 Tax=Streptomyces chisholmiae TaxID=3075540 RepID=A0ABU2JLK6_9ACTN|nr:helix-turn-helix domain-containing protein [Streptomyces sp. DSM 44915]MDT0265850.1 helix-turn-helix domain-containing protein [Streptomyces sp. DSM 44915]